MTRVLSILFIVALSCIAQTQRTDLPRLSDPGITAPALSTAENKSSSNAISETDRLELFKVQRDHSAIQAQFLQMKSQYEDAVKKMLERAGTLEKKFDTLKGKLQSVCGKDATLDEQEGTCVAKPPAPVSMQQTQTNPLPPTPQPSVPANPTPTPVSPSKQ